MKKSTLIFFTIVSYVCIPACLGYKKAIDILLIITCAMLLILIGYYDKRHSAYERVIMILSQTVSYMILYSYYLNLDKLQLNVVLVYILSAITLLPNLYQIKK